MYTCNNYLTTQQISIRIHIIIILLHGKPQCVHENRYYKIQTTLQIRQKFLEWVSVYWGPRDSRGPGWLMVLGGAYGPNHNTIKTNGTFMSNCASARSARKL